MTAQQPQPQPSPIVNLQATPDGKYIAMTTTIFIEVDRAQTLTDALAQMLRQLRTGLVIPKNGSPFDQDKSN